MEIYEAEEFSKTVEDFESTVHSMQIEHKSVKEAKKGDGVGIKVPEKVREGDKVYKITED